MAHDSFLSLSECKEIVERRLHAKNFEVLDYKVNRLHYTGGLLGFHYKVDISLDAPPKENIEKTLRFFLKTKPHHEGSQREFCENVNAFSKEVDILSKLFTRMKSVLRENGKQMVWTCECYFTRPDAIVLEDLSEKQFRSLTSRDDLQYEHFELTMTALANLHAASVIYEEKQTVQPYRLTNEFIDVLREAFFVNIPNHAGKRCMEASVRSVWFIVKLIYGEEMLEKYKDDLEKLILSVYDMQKPSEIFRNVACHGDLKIENILFRCEMNKPVDVRIVDFQLMRYVPPANDIMSLLHLSGSREFREKYFDQLLHVYYEHLSKNMTQHGLNSQNILSYEELKTSCEHYKKLGVVIAASYCPGTYIKGEDLDHVFTSSEAFERYFMIDRTPEIMHSYSTDEYYKMKIADVIDELINLCSK